MRDPIAAMHALYDWAADDLTTDDRTCDARAGSSEHPQDRHGSAPYSLDGSGVTRADLEPLFDEYLSGSTWNWRTAQMRAAVTTEDHGFDIVDVPDPSPGPDELVIGVAGCGVCGSDIKAQLYAPAGMIMGHELGGEIVAVGSSAGEWREGTNIAVLPVFSCGVCEYCVVGAVSHCAQTRYIGMGPAGGFADFAVVPARHAFAMPADLPAIYSALVEPFAVGFAWRAQRRGHLRRRGADRRCWRRRTHDFGVGAREGRGSRHRCRPGSSTSRIRTCDRRHRCPGVGRRRPMPRRTTWPSNVSAGQSWCRHVRLRCVHWVVW